MGMYDEIQWDYWLPDEEHIGSTFQTKDFDNTLSLYKVDEHGKLCIQIEEGTINEPTLILWPCKYVWERYDKSVSVSFYKYLDTKEWLEYKCVIEYGEVIMICKIDERSNR